MTFKRKIQLIVLVGLILATVLIFLRFRLRNKEYRKTKVALEIMHSISSHTFFNYVKELCSDKYGGRLTGAKGFEEATKWVSTLLKKWGLKPGGDDGTYLQNFPNPYTLVLEGSELALLSSNKANGAIIKRYRCEDDYIPGATSDTGDVTAEVVYVGYGITAPELQFDEYKDVNVNGKIVLVEPEVPVSPYENSEEFRKWRPYSFHQYKVMNAKAHGAIGMIYNYHIANPNCQFVQGLILTYAGKSIIEDLFEGTGRTHNETKKRIQDFLQPLSFNTKKTCKMKNFTEHHPEGVGSNVLGYIEGSDPVLKKEAIIIGAHLDHVGRNPWLMPGANDNASGVSVLLGVAEAFSKLKGRMKRTLIFIFFGAEEQGVKGSEFYLKHPLVPNENVTAYINLDEVGRGSKLVVMAARNYPKLWNYFKNTNTEYIHRKTIPTKFHNLTRPRLDAAHFIWANIPTLSFSASGTVTLPYSIHHTSRDTPGIITPEIMEDLAQLLFLAISRMANDGRTL